MALMHTDLPLPVLPAMSRCGILVRSARHAPAMSFQGQRKRRSAFGEYGRFRMLRMLTDVELRLGHLDPHSRLARDGRFDANARRSELSAMSSASPRCG